MKKMVLYLATVGVAFSLSSSDAADPAATIRDTEMYKSLMGARRGSSMSLGHEKPRSPRLLRRATSRDGIDPYAAVGKAGTIEAGRPELNTSPEADKPTSTESQDAQGIESHENGATDSSVVVRSDLAVSAESTVGASETAASEHNASDVSGEAASEHNASDVSGGAAPEHNASLAVSTESTVGASEGAAPEHNASDVSGEVAPEHDASGNLEGAAPEHNISPDVSSELNTQAQPSPELLPHDANASAGGSSEDSSLVSGVNGDPISSGTSEGLMQYVDHLKSKLHDDLLIFGDKLSALQKDRNELGIRAHESTEATQYEALLKESDELGLKVVALKSDLDKNLEELKRIDTEFSDFIPKITRDFEGKLSELLELRTTLTKTASYIEKAQAKIAKAEAKAAAAKPVNWNAVSEFNAKIQKLDEILRAYKVRVKSIESFGGACFSDEGDVELFKADFEGAMKGLAQQVYSESYPNAQKAWSEVRTMSEKETNFGEKVDVLRKAVHSLYRNVNSLILQNSGQKGGRK